MKRWTAFVLTAVMLLMSVLGGMPTASAAMQTTISDRQYDLKAYDYVSADGSMELLSSVEKGNSIAIPYDRGSMDKDVVNSAGAATQMLLLAIDGWNDELQSNATVTIDGRPFSVDSSAAYADQCGFKVTESGSVFVMPFEAPVGGYTDTLVIQIQSTLDGNKTIESAKITVTLKDNTKYVNQTVSDKSYELTVSDWRSDKGIPVEIGYTQSGVSVTAQYDYSSVDADENGVSETPVPMALVTIDGVSVVESPKVMVDGKLLFPQSGAAYAGSVGYATDGETASITFPMELTRAGYSDIFVIQLSGVQDGNVMLTEQIKITVTMKNVEKYYDVSVLDWSGNTNSTTMIAEGGTAETVVAKYDYEYFDYDVTGKWTEEAKMGLICLRGFSAMTDVTVTIDGKILAPDSGASYANVVGYMMDGIDSAVIFPIELTKDGYTDTFEVAVSGTNLNGEKVTEKAKVTVQLVNTAVYKPVNNAMVTNISAVEEGASAYIIGNTLYMDYENEAGAPAIHVTFAKEDGSAYTEIAYATAFAYAADGTFICASDEVKLDAGSATLTLNATAQELNGANVRLSVETQVAYYETRYTVKISQNVRELYWKEATYNVQGQLTLGDGDPETGVLYEQKESGFYAVYIKDEADAFVRLTNAQISTIDVENWDVLSFMALGSGDHFAKLLPINGGMTLITYEADGYTYRMWASSDAVKYNFRVEYEEPEITWLNLAPVAESDTLNLGFHMYSSKGFTKEQAEGVTVSIANASDATYNGFRIELVPECIDEQYGTYRIAIRAEFDENAFEATGGVYTCTLLFMDANGSVCTKLPVKYVNNIPKQLYVRYTNGGYDEQLGYDVYTEVGDYEPVLYLQPMASEPVVFYYYDGTKYVRIEDDERSMLQDQEAENAWYTIDFNNNGVVNMVSDNWNTYEDHCLMAYMAPDGTVYNMPMVVARNDLFALGNNMNVPVQRLYIDENTQNTSIYYKPEQGYYTRAVAESVRAKLYGFGMDVTATALQISVYDEYVVKLDVTVTDYEKAITSEIGVMSENGVINERTQVDPAKELLAIPYWNNWQELNEELRIETSFTNDYRFYYWSGSEGYQPVTGADRSNMFSRNGYINRIDAFNQNENQLDRVTVEVAGRNKGPGMDEIVLVKDGEEYVMPVRVDVGLRLWQQVGQTLVQVNNPFIMEGETEQTIYAMPDYGFTRAEAEAVRVSVDWGILKIDGTEIVEVGEGTGRYAIKVKVSVAENEDTTNVVRFGTLMFDNDDGYIAFGYAVIKAKPMQAMLEGSDELLDSINVQGKAELRFKLYTDEGTKQVENINNAWASEICKDGETVQLANVNTWEDPEYVIFSNNNQWMDYPAQGSTLLTTRDDMGALCVLPIHVEGSKIQVYDGEEWMENGTVWLKSMKDNHKVLYVRHKDGMTQAQAESLQFSYEKIEGMTRFTAETVAMEDPLNAGSYMVRMEIDFSLINMTELLVKVVNVNGELIGSFNVIHNEYIPMESNIAEIDYGGNHYTLHIAWNQGSLEEPIYEYNHITGVNPGQYVRMGLAAFDEYECIHAEEALLMDQIENVEILVEKKDDNPVVYAENGYGMETYVEGDGYLYVTMNVSFKEESGISDVTLLMDMLVFENIEIIFERPADDTVEELNEFLKSDELYDALIGDDELPDVTIRLHAEAVYEGTIVIPDTLPEENNLSIIGGSWRTNANNIKSMTTVQGNVIVAGHVLDILNVRFVNQEGKEDMIAIQVKDGNVLHNVGYCIFDGYYLAMDINTGIVWNIYDNRVKDGWGGFRMAGDNDGRPMWIEFNDFINLEGPAITVPSADYVELCPNFYGETETKPMMPVMDCGGLNGMPMYASAVYFTRGNDIDKVALIDHIAYNEDGSVSLSVVDDGMLWNKQDMRIAFESATGGVNVTCNGEAIEGCYYDAAKHCAVIMVEQAGEYVITEGEAPAVQVYDGDELVTDGVVRIKLGETRKEITIRHKDGFTYEEAENMLVWYYPEFYDWNGVDCGFDFENIPVEGKEDRYDVKMILTLDNLNDFEMGFVVTDENEKPYTSFLLACDVSSENTTADIRYDGQDYKLGFGVLYGPEDNIMVDPIVGTTQGHTGDELVRRFAVAAFDAEGEALHENADALLEMIESVTFAYDVPEEAVINAEEKLYGYYGFTITTPESGYIRSTAKVTFKEESGLQPVELKLAQTLELSKMFRVFRDADDTTEALNAYMASEEFRQMLEETPESVDVRINLDGEADYHGKLVVPEGLPRPFGIEGNVNWDNNQPHSITDVYGGIEVHSDLSQIYNMNFVYTEETGIENGFVVDEGVNSGFVISNWFSGYPEAAAVLGGGDGYSNFSNNVVRDGNIGLVVRAGEGFEIGIGENDFIDLKQDVSAGSADVIYMRPNFYGESEHKMRPARVYAGGELLDVFPVFTDDVALEDRNGTGEGSIVLIDAYEVSEDGTVTVHVVDDGNVEFKVPMAIPFETEGGEFAVEYEGTLIGGCTYDADRGVMIVPVEQTGAGTYVIRGAQKAMVTLTSRLEGTAEQSIATLQGGGAYEMGAAVTVTAPVVTGCKFLGWYAAADNEAGYDGQCLSAEMSYSFTAQGDTALVAVYRASGANGRFKVYGSDYMLNGAGPKKGATNKQVRVGETIELEYVGEDEFLYWKNGSDKIVSRDKTYTFTFVTDTELSIAVVEKDGMSTDGVNCALIEFVSDYGQVMYADTWYSTDVAADMELPDGPSKPGYTFVGWEYTAEQIISRIDGSAGVITIRPVYKEGVEQAVFTVSNNVDDIVSRIEAQYGQSLWVKAPARDGWKFSHMEDENGNVISYSENHAFWVNGDYSVRLVYVMSDEAVSKEPTLVMAGSRLFEENGKQKASFTVTRDVPEGYTLIEHGVLVNRDGTLAAGEAELEMVIGSDKVIKATSSDPAAMGTYVQNVVVVVPEAEIYCRGYMICSDENGEVLTFYTDVAKVQP